MKTVRLLAFFLCIVMAGTLIPARSQAPLGIYRQTE